MIFGSRHRLRGVPDQPLPRLCAAGPGIHGRRPAGIGLGRQGHHRVGRDRRRHLPRHQLRQDGRLLHRWRLVGHRHPRGLPRPRSSLLPAIITLVGPKGWIKPRNEITAQLWRRSSARIVRQTRGCTWWPACWCCSCWPAPRSSRSSTTTTARPSRHRPWLHRLRRARSPLQRQPDRCRRMSSSSRRATCAPRKPSPTSSRWRRASANCRTSPWSAASPRPSPRRGAARVRGHLQPAWSVTG